MAARVAVQCVVAVLLSHLALAEPSKDRIPPFVSTDCRDITGSSVPCGSDGTWTRRATSGVDFGGTLTQPKSAFSVEDGFRIASTIIGGAASSLLNLIFGIVDAVKKRDSRLEIRCPGPIRGVADKLQTSVHLSWENPQAQDNKGNKKDSKCDPESGSEFPEGQSLVQCWAANENGQMAICSFSVTVEVHRCPPMTWPSDGEVSCTGSSVLGSSCDLTCDEGFKAKGSSSSSCENTGRSVARFRCAPEECKELPSVKNGFISCSTKPVYRTYCQLICDRGYRLRGTPTILCQGDGTFTAPGRCEDDESPTFPSGCPPNDEIFAAPLGEQTLLKWDPPEVKDNSGKYDLTCSHNVSHGLGPGRHTILYTATDAAGNKATCSFQVIIKTISCSPPSFDKSGKDLMAYKCPHRFVVGAQCTVSCKYGFPQVGPSTLYCERDDSTYPPTGHWSTNDTINPECRVVECPALRPPKNGALACDQWGYGQVCSMLCNDKYDIPLQIRRNGEFVCGQSTGTWKPPDVPDCTETRQPGSMRLPSQLYYYTGNCPDNATQEQIKTNFIEILKQSKFPEKCINVPECRVDMVLVTCGPVSFGRRRRRAARRSVGYEILVDFVISATLPPGQSGTQAAPLLQSLLSDVSAVLRLEAAAGTFDLQVNGLDLKGEDFASGSPVFACEDGTMLSPDKTCAGCSSGTFFNASVSDCQDCPKGHYADRGFASTCTPCPAKTSTNGTGKSSIEDCLGECGPGWVSDTGLEPCQQCPVGSFQAQWGHTLCSQCPSLSSTPTPGATSQNQCLAMDGCDSSPCGNHSCVSVPGGWQCQCHGGWSGSNCSTPPNLCLKHQCQNGASCVNGLHNYSCLCEPGFKGELCNKAIRDGEWSAWSNWTECSATCGGGSSSRQRSCDSPSPDPDGLPCVGPSVESRSCHTQPCPSCPRIPRPYGVVWNCTEEEGMTSCTAGCRDGLVLASPRMSVYQCGRLNNYTWTFVSPDTPEGFVPECTEAQTPEEMVLRVTSSVELDCQEATSKRDEALQRPREAVLGLDCVRNGKCQTEVTLSACPTSHLWKRSTSSRSSNVTVTLTSQLTSERLDLSSNFSDVNEATSGYVAVLTSLSHSLEQLQNETSRFLTVEVGGQMYPPSPPSFSGDVTCPPGTVPAQVACGACPRGTYQSGVQCVLCGRGSYADSTGSTRCRACPPGLSTQGLAATSASQCSIEVAEEHQRGEEGEDRHDGSVLKLVLPVVFSVLAVAVAIPLSIWFWQKHKRRNFFTSAHR